jgi:serine/threonine protein kinase
MLDDIKDHCSATFKYIGAGTYCEAFKFYYDKDNCPHLKTNNETECTQCKLYTHTENYVIKEIQKTHRYSQNDFDSEVFNQKTAMEYMPDLIVNIIESWDEVHDSDMNGIIIGKLGSKTNENKNSVITAYGYITMEYMNYKDLYLNYKSGNPNVNWSRPINMLGLVFICLIILYNLHCKLAICHGDFRDTNIFLKYIGPDYKQHVKVDIDDKINEYIVETGGFHIKLGDFGLSEPLYADSKSFIFRDYEFLENIYRNRDCWKWMTADKSEYTQLITFLQTNFINNINQRMDYYHYIPEQVKSRTEFWYAKHNVSTQSIYLYKFPKDLLERFIKTFYQD